VTFQNLEIRQTLLYERALLSGTLPFSYIYEFNYICLYVYIYSVHRLYMLIYIFTIQGSFCGEYIHVHEYTCKHIHVPQKTGGCTHNYRQVLRYVRAPLRVALPVKFLQKSEVYPFYIRPFTILIPSHFNRLTSYRQLYTLRIYTYIYICIYA